METGKQRGAARLTNSHVGDGVHGMEISHLLDNNNTGSIGSPREGRQGDCLGLVMTRSGGLGHSVYLGKMKKWKLLQWGYIGIVEEKIETAAMGLCRL